LSEEEIDDRLILQPVDTGVMIPSSLTGDALFLLNLARVINQDIWDNLGSKEQIQAAQLRALASHFTKMADLLEELGHYLSAVPDPYDFENGDYEQSWEDINEEADTQTTDDYARLGSIIEELLDAAAGDFMD